ncbi:hypothetical protein [Lentzea sp. CC55]|uniref:hypothetical protein n=1 Tax=Lentzea sp. CC55 TaxID=2884909 RepID=UPI001F48890C|nr:hypothetical protein [Lentzea sp. CC55]MCG8927211.1 hypothetical protein [Lentzea sp. CC55]
MAHEYLIIGAGPAGLQLPALPARDGRDHAVLERGSGDPFDISVPRVVENDAVNTGCPHPVVRDRQPLVAFVEECLAGA